MANNCMVGITVTTFTEADGEKLHGILTSAKVTADKKAGRHLHRMQETQIRE